MSYVVSGPTGIDEFRVRRVCGDRGMIGRRIQGKRSWDHHWSRPVQPAVGGLANHNLPVGEGIGIPCYDSRIKVSIRREGKPWIGGAGERSPRTECQGKLDSLPGLPVIE